MVIMNIDFVFLLLVFFFDEDGICFEFELLLQLVNNYFFEVVVNGQVVDMLIDLLKFMVDVLDGNGVSFLYYVVRMNDV